MNKTIAYITDIHLDEAFVIENGVDSKANWKQIIDDVNRRNIDSIIFGGDIGEPSVNAWFFASLQNFNLEITPGNHDTFIEVRKYVKREEWMGKTEGFYAKEDEHFKYLYLDSSKNILNSSQLLWLTEALTTGKTVLLFIHHPILPVDTAVDKIYPLEDRDQVKQLLTERTGRTIIFCGHYHMPDESCEGLIQQFVTPAASFQIIKEANEIAVDTSKFGYRLIHLNEDKISTELVWFT